MNSESIVAGCVSLCLLWPVPVNACGDNRDQDVNIRNCTKDIEANPRNATAYGNRSAAHYSKREYDRAIKDATTAIRLDKKSHVPYKFRALSHLKKGNLDRALADINEAIRLLPYTGHYWRGRIYMAMTKYKLAIIDFDLAIRLNDHPQARAYRANAITALESPVACESAAPDIPTCNEIIAADSGNARAYYYRAKAYLGRFNFGHAIADYNVAIRLDPSYAPAYGKRGEAHYKVGNYYSAIADIDSMLELGPRTAKAYAHRGLSHVKVGQYELAIKDFDELFRLSPDHARVGDWRSDAIAKLGSAAMARAASFGCGADKYYPLTTIRNCTKAIEAFGRIIIYWVHRSAAYHATGQYVRAIEDASVGIVLTQHYTRNFRLAVQLYLQRGRTYYAANHLREAKLDFTESIRLAKSIKFTKFLDEAYVFRASIHLQQGVYAGAMVDANAGLKIAKDPGMINRLKNIRDQADVLLRPM